MSEELKEPDINRCQAESKQGSFMTLGPRSYKRCNNLPTYIAFENEPGGDGKQGSMSLCEGCKENFIKQLGPKYATLTRIKRRTPVKK